MPTGPKSGPHLRVVDRPLPSRIRHRSSWHTNLMRAEIVAHQRKARMAIRVSPNVPPTETMPQAVWREVLEDFVCHQLLPRLASAEHLVEAAPHILNEVVWFGWFLSITRSI